MARPIVVAIKSDVHAGSTLGPCPPDVRLDDGGLYLPSKPQSWLYECMQDYWAAVAAERAKQRAVPGFVDAGIDEHATHGT